MQNLSMLLAPAKQVEMASIVEDPKEPIFEGQRSIVEPPTDPGLLEKPYIQRLPNELLQKTFMSCIPEGTFPTLTLSEAPLLLTQISRRWKQLALTRPSSGLQFTCPCGRITNIWTGPCSSWFIGLTLLALPQWKYHSGQFRWRITRPRTW
ncbi:hypothetical protein NMY22_g16110 [Coprinellus aureogranulatus]|nr:hypothetical protein NMY22_g16110 [Coprinellus aureogranulatus]